jgi:hypothetical protein
MNNPEHERKRFTKDRTVNRNYDELPPEDKAIIRESRAGLTFDSLNNSDEGKTKDSTPTQ